MSGTEVPEDVREAAGVMSRMWWLSLVTGILWFVIAIVILQMNSASVATVGVIVGAMFLFTGIQQFAISTVVEGWKWQWRRSSWAACCRRDWARLPPVRPVSGRVFPIPRLALPSTRSAGPV